jgi:hypothetical protein
VLLQKSPDGTRFHATGEVSLSGAEIGGQLGCAGGRFENAKGRALSAEGARVSRDVFLRDAFHATGAVRLSGAEIGGQLGCDGGRFENAGGDALSAERLKVTGGLFWRGVEIASGRVTFAAAHVGDLVDDLPSWPAGEDRLYLDGFTYDRISAAFTDARARLAWLARGTVRQGEFYPQPYVQLARVLREMGHEAGARDVMTEQGRLIRLYARKRARVVEANGFRGKLRKLRAWALNPLRWLWDIGLRWGVGYGYDPKRALYWLLALFFIASIAAEATWCEGSFAPNSDVLLVSPGWAALANDPATANPAAAWSGASAPGRDWETFNAWGYGADVVVPILALGQTAAWAPSTTRGPWGRGLWWGRWLLTMAGWFVSALGLAAITGIIRRD